MLSRESYEYRAQIIKALAHPSRLIIIDALSEGEKCVCELQEIVESDITTVSKHLSVLKSSGLVCSRKQGLQVYYRLRLPCILNFFSCVDAAIEEDVELRGTRTLVRNG
ncbi:MAG: ArsR/SmtB family transcription factor [Armatimonadota bacterium]